VATPYAYEHHTADHQVCKEFTFNSYYFENLGNDAGRHMWDGRTVSVPKDHPWLAINKPNGPYSYAKSPRHYNNEGTLTIDHPLDAYLPYEVGPLARLMSNAVLIGGGPATAGQVTLVDQGDVSLYYPGILADVDAVLGGVLGMGATGVFPNWGANMAGHLTFLQTAIPGSPALYLPPGALPAAVLANQFGHDYYGGATLDRIAARTMETYYVAKQMLTWFNQLVPPAAGSGAKKSTDHDYDPTYPYDSNWPAYTRSFDDGSGGFEPAPFKAQGAGLTEAPRGALGHWIRVYQGKVYNYQIITPTTWNINPKDAVSGTHKTLGQHGPIEECIQGTPLVAEAEPLEILRVIHSFDPCCACTVHVMDAKKEKKFKGTLEPMI
jgi:Ni,Fe-hydrogenase I large subunit